MISLLTRIVAAVLTTALCTPSIATGEAGAAFTRLRMDGTDIPDGARVSTGSAARHWACTRDNRSGLTWEIKTADRKLRDRNWSFTPYLREWREQGVIHGYRDTVSGQCDRKHMAGGSCNIDAYIDAINDSKLCGYTDWRLPTVVELLEVSAHREGDSGDNRPGIPDPQPGWYWTGTFEADGLPFQRVMLLQPGGSPRLFDGTYYLWLVRGGRHSLPYVDPRAK